MGRRGRHFSTRSCFPSKLQLKPASTLEGACSCSVVGCSGVCMREVSDVFDPEKISTAKRLLAPSAGRERPVWRGKILLHHQYALESPPRSLCRDFLKQAAEQVLVKLPNSHRLVSCNGIPRTRWLAKELVALYPGVTTEITLQKGAESFPFGPASRVGGSTR